MSKIALEHGATIDKYIGDAILAFFGDPETRGVKEDAMACVNMAIAMQRRMRELQFEWRDAGLEKPFQLRIGINTGYCTVGNFGSEDRMDYTIIGNEVNLASRLQSHAEPGSILISHETYSLVKDIVLAEEQDPIQAKGFAKPVRNYKVLDQFDKLTDQSKSHPRGTRRPEDFPGPAEAGQGECCPGSEEHPFATRELSGSPDPGLPSQRARAATADAGRSGWRRYGRARLSRCWPRIRICVARRSLRSCIAAILAASTTGCCGRCNAVWRAGAPSTAPSVS